MARKYTRKVRRNKRHTRKRGGGLFNFLTKPMPVQTLPSTHTVYKRDIFKHAQNIDITDIDYLKNTIIQRIDILFKLFNECKAQCLDKLCLKNEATCAQAQNMSLKRPASEFTGFCRVTDTHECQKFKQVLNSLTKIVYDIDSKIKVLDNTTKIQQYNTIKLFILTKINEIEKQDWKIKNSKVYNLSNLYPTNSVSDAIGINDNEDPRYTMVSPASSRRGSNIPGIVNGVNNKIRAYRTLMGYNNNNPKRGSQINLTPEQAAAISGF